jgi:regulatory LuxR family protein
MEHGERPLTDRERLILRRAGDSETTAELARSLRLTEGTVRNYLSEASSNHESQRAFKERLLARLWHFVRKASVASVTLTRAREGDGAGSGLGSEYSGDQHRADCYTAATVFASSQLRSPVD